MGRPKIDIINKTFGYLIAKEYVEGGYWICDCICGNEVKVNSNSLRRGISTSCGCKNSNKFIDMTGEIYGEWIVLKYNKQRKGWLCKCSCGQEKYVTRYDLIKGKSKSCGHAEDLTNKVFGKWTVLECVGTRINGTDIVWKCVCECGSIKNVGAIQLKNGLSKSCGCFRGSFNREKLSKNHISQRFGKLKVLKKTQPDKHLCRCDCGREKEIHTTSFVNHGQRDCGECQQFEKDLSFMKFNKLTVFGYIGNSNWYCICECGNTKIASTYDLNNNDKISCGCQSPEKKMFDFESLEGINFGRWRVLSDKRNDIGDRETICECKCGTVKHVHYSRLKKGTSLSCGCYKSDLYKSIVGSAHRSWKGGGTKLKLYLRAKLSTWKLEILKKYDYKCAIYPELSENIKIHHIYPFSKIFQETMSILDLPIYQEIGQYTPDELKAIVNTCLDLHCKYESGIPLSKNIHIEFHKKYTNYNFTSEDFYKFYKDKTGRVYSPSFLVRQNI